MTFTSWISWGKSFSLIFFGNVLLAAASAFFLVPMQIVNGGMNGVALIFYELYAWPIDLTTAFLAWGFFLLGILLLGKDFSLKTISSTIIYPLFLFLFLRFVQPNPFEFDLLNDTHRLLAAMFGGALVGFGVALSFLAGGSTGGFDVLILSLKKYAEVKVSVSSLVLDGLIIVLGMLTFGLLLGLYGIVSIVVTALLIELVFVGFSKTYFVTIISKETLKINKFILEVMSRGSTIIPARGGYSDTPVDLLQVAINRSEYFTLKQYIASVDPKAFVVFTQVRSINGLGFDPLLQVSSKKKGISE
jgi:uncharacterized membrane-anchored protein YitT (DUF2179 family)